MAEPRCVYRGEFFLIDRRFWWAAALIFRPITVLVLKPSVAPVGLTSKRIVDIVLALSGILLLAPLLIICFVVTWTSSPWPVIFRHKRIGFNGKTFDCLKFRTMVADAPERLCKLLETDAAAAAEWAQCQKLRNDPRVTPIGAVLRKSSLDELPQLFNVLIGDLSIVGPRPVTEAELSRYGASVTAYTACRPGITGLCQVTGRSSTRLGSQVNGYMGVILS